VHLAWKEKWSDVQLCTDLLTIANGLTWKEWEWKIACKEIWGKGMWLDLSGWTKVIFADIHVLCNAHQ
jgi:hypothetical protein